MTQHRLSFWSFAECYQSIPQKISKVFGNKRNPDFLCCFGFDSSSLWLCLSTTSKHETRGTLLMSDQPKGHGKNLVVNLLLLKHPRRGLPSTRVSALLFQRDLPAPVGDMPL
ncbi:hypothetical protein Z043_122394 [Scleropages formosus]|uniref:Uncharacterized protein n=1 Tax=Scleropages formosus TaxID=113540 RepID=A0A0P7UF76_SCLFO|nr:hypothetical protein Z043_122394 [Scleropages formosus]